MFKQNFPFIDMDTNHFKKLRFYQQDVTSYNRDKTYKAPEKEEEEEKAITSNDSIQIKRGIFCLFHFIS